MTTELCFQSNSPLVWIGALIYEYWTAFSGLQRFCQIVKISYGAIYIAGVVKYIVNYG